MNTEAVWKLMR